MGIRYWSDLKKKNGKKRFKNALPNDYDYFRTALLQLSAYEVEYVGLPVQNACFRPHFPAALVIKYRRGNGMCAVIMHAVRCNKVGESPVAFKVIRANDFHHLAVSVSGDAGMVKGNHDEVARAVRGGVIYRIPADAVFIDNFDFARFFIQIHAVKAERETSHRFRLIFWDREAKEKCAVFFLFYENGFL